MAPKKRSAQEEQVIEMLKREGSRELKKKDIERGTLQVYL
jgi:hypothetical protein